MKGTLVENVQVTLHAEPKTYGTGASPLTPTGVDCKDYEELMVVLSCGVFSATGDIAVKLQESDDNSTFSDITSATFTAVALANDQAVYVNNLNLRYRKRYIRAHVTIADDDTLFGINFILGAARKVPVTQTATVAFKL